MKPSFIEVLAVLRRWLIGNNIDRGTAHDPVKVTIEAPNLEAACGLLYSFKRELQPLVFMGANPDIDFDRPMRIAGFEVTFKMPDGHQRQDYVFQEDLGIRG